MLVKILVIDDSRTLTRLLKDYLTIKGHEVNITHDGTSGISLIEQFQYDVVLLDYNMPGINGEEVIEILHDKNLINKSSVILFTAANVDSVFVEKQKKSGIIACLKKPVQVDVLEKALLQTEEIINS